jgi:hypothetical protein
MSWPRQHKFSYDSVNFYRSVIFIDIRTCERTGKTRTRASAGVHLSSLKAAGGPRWPNDTRMAENEEVADELAEAVAEKTTAVAD